MEKFLRKIFGLKEPKKLLVCPKTGWEEINPDNKTPCVECSQKIYKIA